MSDRIERIVELNAPVARVWRALTDHHEFGSWFGVTVDQAFAAGVPSTGIITMKSSGKSFDWRAEVVAIEPETRFAFTWHPYALDPAQDYSGETPTLVEFILAPTDTGTRLTVSESGFDRLPPERRDIAFRMNGEGWRIQADRIRDYVEG